MYHQQQPRPAAPHTVRRMVVIAVGVLVGLMMMAALFGGGSPDAGSTSGGSSQTYSDGSITKTDDGTIIYSDSDGNSFSTG